VRDIRQKNSQEDALRREKRSLLGKIDRRYTAINFARSDISEYSARLRHINDSLAQYKTKIAAAQESPDEG
jgi:chromosome segregation ATPase